MTFLDYTIDLTNSRLQTSNKFHNFSIYRFDCDWIYREFTHYFIIYQEIYIWLWSWPLIHFCWSYIYFYFLILYFMLIYYVIRHVYHFTLILLLYFFLHILLWVEFILIMSCFYAEKTNIVETSISFILFIDIWLLIFIFFTYIKYIFILLYQLLLVSLTILRIITCKYLNKCTIISCQIIFSRIT